MWPLIAAAAGSVLGSVGNYMNGRDNAAKLGDAYDQVAGLASQAVAKNDNDIADYRNKIQSLYGNAPVQYNQQLANFINSPMYQQGTFGFDESKVGDINTYYDPAANQRVQQAMDAIANSGATGGNRFSSDYLGRMGAKQQSLASEEWEKAYNKLTEARNAAFNQQLAAFNANEAAKGNAYNANYQKNSDLLNLFNNQVANYENGISNALSADMQNRLGGLNTQAQTIMGKAQANQNTSGWNLLSGLGNAAGSFLGSYFGGK
jgi:hypothetical protein